MTEEYECFNCGARASFDPHATDLENLTRGGWLVEEAVGGRGKAYCPNCKVNRKIMIDINKIKFSKHPMEMD